MSDEELDDLLTSGGAVNDRTVQALLRRAGGWQHTPITAADELPAAQERETIVAVLRKANGRVSGKGGAAELLGVRPTTLYSRLKRFGIETRGRSRRLTLNYRSSRQNLDIASRQRFPYGIAIACGTTVALLVMTQ